MVINVGTAPGVVPDTVTVAAVVKLTVLPGATSVATPAMIGVIVFPVVTVPTVPEPETVIAPEPAREVGKVTALLAASETMPTRSH